jgi:transposase
VRDSSVWRRLLGVENVIVEGVRLEQDELVVEVRLYRRQRNRCGRCGQRSPRYDAGEGRRRWRALDLGTTRAFIEAGAPRVACRRHGVVVAQVPWADHHGRFTRHFEEQIAWLAVECSKTAVAALMRISWRSIGPLLVRVTRRLLVSTDRLDGLRRIGIDEISFRKGQRYLIVVVDHDRQRLVWAREGRDERTLWQFFDDLGAERCAAITHVSADAATWIANVVTARCPQAIQCLDPFHVVAWATQAIDEIRRELWNAARHAGEAGRARLLKGARWALWKNADNLSASQQRKLAWVQRVNQPLYRAYLLKEHLRLIFQLPFVDALELLDEWLDWAARSRLQPFVDLAHRVANHIDALVATLEHRLSNALVEAVNTRIRLIIRRAYGFHSARPLIALAMLSCGDCRPTLPGRAD